MWIQNEVMLAMVALKLASGRNRTVGFEFGQVNLDP